MAPVHCVLRDAELHKSQIHEVRPCSSKPAKRWPISLRYPHTPV